MEILSDQSGAEIQVEGIVEDIDIVRPSGICAVQCKYHEGQEKFQLSTVYKPVLQMMGHFKANPSICSEYIVHAYFPDQTANSLRTLTVKEANEILATRDGRFANLVKAAKGVNKTAFLRKFKIRFGSRLEDLVGTVCDLLASNGISKGDIDTLAYPNALQIIADLSISHNPEARKICKADLLERLAKIKTTAVSRWTRELRDFSMLMSERRKQLKNNMKANSRLRYFLIQKGILNDFDDLPTFIRDYVDHYHFKPLHLKTPLFFVDCSEDELDEFNERLFALSVKVNNGLISRRQVSREALLREPFVGKGSPGDREFQVRLARFDECEAQAIIGQTKCHDLFLIGSHTGQGLNLQDINVERIEVTKLDELRYLLQMRDSYE